MKRTGDLKLIQELNRSIILDTIRLQGPISRSDIAKLNKLSPTTVTSAVSELIQEGLVYEDGIGHSSGGRKPILVRFSPDSKFLIAISIRNSFITIAEMNLEAKVKQKEIHSTNGYSGDDVINYLLDLIETFLNSSINKDLCIGISVITQGIVNSSKGVIRYNAELKLKNVPLKDLLEQRFNKKSYLDNDTNAYLLAEKNFGLYNLNQNMIYITQGDGVGAGLLVNGSIYRGHSGGAGEFGHTSIDRGGFRCECGNIGCLETYVSWPAIFSRILSSLSSGKSSGMLEKVNGKMTEITPAIFSEALQEHDELAIKLAEETVSYLSASIVNLVHLFNPEVIIIGGEVVANNPIYLAKLRTSVLENVMEALSEDLEIHAPSLGDELEMIGAASVLLQDKFHFSLNQVY
ncbi:ROK family transcriptional regulator [Metabacillus litoralis]|uniref:Transcriptional regulator n=1 Tax=Metabacillus litoralis TaxID=152268 RepID=A0A179SNG0_9BACI|nr:ROK family transcriptional regulator [Metabacillus litoralis]OAS82510.1 transcriptional regulator [Metabacillus litoralis]